VYLYTDAASNERVAIKRLQLDTTGFPGLAQMLAQYIPRELRNHYMLNHHHIVKLKDAFTDDDNSHLNLVLEYVDGGVLLTHVNQLMQQNRQNNGGGLVSEDVARWYFQQLIVTLDYLHAKGVSHRDIKLENALLKLVPNSNRHLIKVADLGLSRLGPIAQTLNVGTVAYQAPEVIVAPQAPPPAAFQAPEALANENPGYDARKADIWSAGVLLYAMLAGNYPFPENIPRPQRLQAMQARPLRGLPQHLSQECKQLLEALLNPNPAERISIQSLKQDPWFTQGLPAAAFDMTAQCINRPSPCIRTPQEIEETIARVVQRLQQQV